MVDAGHRSRSGDDGRTGRLLTVREVATNRNGPVVLRADLPGDAYLRVLGLDDQDPEHVAAQMLRDWQHNCLFSDRLIFDQLVR